MTQSAVATRRRLVRPGRPMGQVRRVGQVQRVAVWRRPDRTDAEQAGAGEAGSASVWVLAVAMAVLAIAGVAIVVVAAISVRHRAESAADLAALAGAVAARDGGDGCRAAATVAAANRATVAGCRVGLDASITVVVAVPLPPAVRRWSTADAVRAVARAGS